MQASITAWNQVSHCSMTYALSSSDFVCIIIALPQTSKRFSSTSDSTQAIEITGDFCGSLILTTLTFLCLPTKFKQCYLEQLPHHLSSLQSYCITYNSIRQKWQIISNTIFMSTTSLQNDCQKRQLNNTTNKPDKSRKRLSLVYAVGHPTVLC